MQTFYFRELIGVEYLYSQTNRALEEDIAKDPDVPDGLQDEDLLADLEGDEGFEDAYLDEPTEFMELEGNLQNPSQPPSQTDSAAVSSSPASSSQSQMDRVGPNGQPGYDHVIRLADCLVDLRLQGFVTQSMVDEIVMLWNHLADHDKGPLIYSPCHRDRLLKGRFKVSHSKTNVTPGTDSLKRCFLGEGGPAQWPSTSRLVEAICLALCRIHPAGQTIAGVRVNRWAAILRDYRKIRHDVLGSPGIMAQTKLKLFELNQLTISQWSKRGRFCSRTLRRSLLLWWPLYRSHQCCKSCRKQSSTDTCVLSLQYRRMRLDRQHRDLEADHLLWAQRKHLSDLVFMSLLAQPTLPLTSHLSPH
ncbi:uncharacterized protein LOC130237793 [Danio aesculapii]|uniref:uncharacterized protein LOC130237793 n=1 Tax=Danio aesculapii TaxID=1142201 RepID=UPI0024BF61EE|nr:uncharacterized protein LOC130237793 [Danio aesculapii]